MEFPEIFREKDVCVCVCVCAFTHTRTQFNPFKSLLLNVFTIFRLSSNCIFPNPLALLAGM